MNRKEAIESLESIIDTYEILLGHGVNSDILSDDDINAIRMAIDSLKIDDMYDLLYEKNADICERWIPVSERLPEKNMRCLVAVGRFNFTQIATYSDLMETIDHRIFYQGDYGNGNFEDITKYVKAWQPLPEPYKAESEEK